MILHSVYLGLGTNLGDKEKNMQDALQNIEKRIGSVVACSAFYVTDPVGFESDNQFINAVCLVTTKLDPIDLLAVTQQIEIDMGRLSKSVNGIHTDRIIDIDILVYDDWKVNLPQLKLPHPHILKRDFVRLPLQEIAADVVRQLENH